MKMIHSLIRMALVTTLVVTSSIGSLIAQEVLIPDAGLNAAVRDALQIPNGPLTQQDMLNLTNLNASGRSISTIEGLGAAHNLRTLNLDSNSLTNLVVPGGFAALTQLNLRSNQLSSLTLPSDVTNLVTLVLDGNPLITFVVSQPVADTNLAGVVASLQNQGVNVHTYPLSPQLLRPAVLIGAFKLGLKGPPGIYLIESSTNLISWNPIRTTVNNLGSVNFVDSSANLSSNKFYRALLLNPPENMVFIAPNTFTMGSPTNELDRDINEGPQTTVTLTRGFWMGKFEVTQGEYLSVMNTNPSQFPGDLSRPVSSVSWPDATNYCWTLTQQELAAGRIPAGSQYRLPTEAEWECAARAGTTTRFSYGDDPTYTNLPDYAWLFTGGGLMVHPVGKKLPNPWGLYDMYGNVAEWCQDWLGPLPGGAVTDPVGPDSNPIGWKVMRGGAFDLGESDCRSARRLFFPSHPALNDWNLGFRIVLVIGPQ